MYEDKYKNLITLELKDLENLLQLLADLDEELELFAIGGTAMILQNIKESTRDVDFLTNAKYEKIKRMFTTAGLKEISSAKSPNIWKLEKIRVDLFYDGFIGITLPDDWKEISTFNRRVGKVSLYVLNWYDVIITKIARAEKRDYEDIIDIIHKEKIDLNFLKQRYFELAPTAIIANYEEKFKHLEVLLK